MTIIIKGEAGKQGKNHLDSSKSFPRRIHFTAQVDKDGKQIRYSGWKPNPQNPHSGYDLDHRIDFVRPAHGSVETPHTHVPKDRQTGRKKDCFPFTGPCYNFQKPPSICDPGNTIPRHKPNEL